MVSTRYTKFTDKTSGKEYAVDIPFSIIKNCEGRTIVTTLSYELF